jgi:hypothetical protein
MKLRLALLVTTVVALTLTFSGGADAATANFPVRCTGSDAASQGSLALVGGAIDANVSVTHDAAVSEVPGALVSPSFTVATSIAPGLIDTAISLLGISSVSVKDVNFAVTGAGAGVSQSASFGPFSDSFAVSPGTGLQFSRGPVETAEQAVTSGVISYRLTPIKMNVAIGAINVNVTCSPVGSNVVAKTVVRDPDAPLAGNTSIETSAGGSVSIDLSELVTPGPTPIIDDSYKVREGLGFITGSTLNVKAPTEPGTYTTTYEVCALPKPNSGTPGVNETAQIAFSKVEQNERPVAFSLKVGDVETPLVWTTKRTPGLWPWINLPASNGSQSKTNMNDWGEYLFTTSFQAPTATNVQDALTAAGFETSVTGTFGNFTVEFVGKDAAKDMPDVTVGRWLTVLPYEFFTQISELVSGLSASSGNGGPAAPLLTDDQIVQLIFSGQVDAAGNAIKARILAGLTDVAPQLLELLVNSFAQPPVIDSVNGEAPEPAQLLCSQGQVDVTVVAVAGVKPVDPPAASPPPPAEATAPEPGVKPLSFTG